MLLTRLLYYLRGYLVISVTGIYPERFLNVCANRHILLWNVLPRVGGKLHCCIGMRDFRLLPPVARKTGVQIKILHKRGLPVLLAKTKGRRVFAAGLIVFVTAMIVANQFVWKLKIEGCESLTADYITEKLAECGLHIGSFRPRVDAKQLQNQMLIRVPELAWLWVDTRGSKVLVQVRERVQPPAIVQTDAYCDLVAAKDGVIDSMVITAGTPLVESGATVRRGDLLVSGLLVSDKGLAPRKVQSEGSIYARVWYEKTQAFSVWSPVTHDTGRRENKYTLALFGWRLPLFHHGETSFNTYVAAEQEYELSIGNFYLGLGLERISYTEQETTYEKMSTESTIEAGKLTLQNEIDAMTAADATLTDCRITSSVLDDETVEVTVIAEYLENIAEKHTPTEN